MSFGTCTQQVLSAGDTNTHCVTDAVVLFGDQKQPLCLPHFEFQLTRARRVIDRAAGLIAQAQRELGGSATVGGGQ